MATFAQLTAQLNLNIANFATNIQRATAQANTFAANLQGKINSGMVDPVKKAKFEFKDVARIVQGILISKAFYSGLNAIRNAKSAVWEFSQELEYASMVYKNLFGNTALAEEFINVLKDFAAKTPFTFEQSEDAAKRLLAYGMQYKNVMYVMKGVLAAATVQGSEQAVESVSRALGQIYTKGTLKAEEMRQLAEAGIPAWEILREKLGLTADQLSKIGSLGIPASTAINALVDGINERFGGVLQQSSKTTQGLISNIKDLAVMLGSGLLKPITDKIHNALVNVEAFVSKLYDIYELKGLGGIFEELVPPEFREAIRTLVVNLKGLWSVLKTMLSSAFVVLKAAIRGVIQALNVLLPIINAVLGFNAAIYKTITDNAKAVKVLTSIILGAAAAWLVYKTYTIAAGVATVVVKSIIAVVKGLSIALTFLVAHPVWALLAVGIGLFVGLSGASDKFAASVRKLFSSLTSLAGASSNDILLPEAKTRAADVDKFNESLDGTKDSLNSLAAAGKKAKGLLSFDEVFKLPETSSADSDYDYKANPALDLSGFADAVEEIGSINYGNIANGFVNGLIAAFGGKKQLLSVGIGSLLGSAIGGIIGGRGGAIIGAALGGLAGWVWPKISEKLGLTNVGNVVLPIATGLGLAIGYIAGGPLGALVGAGIGALVGFITDEIAEGIQTGDWTGAATPIGTGLGAAIGFIIGGPPGALIGAGVGAVVGYITDLFIDGFTNGNWKPDLLGTLLGGALGAGIGYIAFGPVGAIIGAAIGALVGWIVGIIVKNWDAIVAWMSKAIADTGIFLTNVANSIALWIDSVLESIGIFFVNLWNSVSGWFVRLFTNIGNWLSSVWTSIKTWFSNVVTGLGTWLVNVWTAIKNWFTTAISNVGTWLSTAWTNIKTWFTNIITGVGTWLADVWKAIKNWFTTAIANVGTFFTKIGTDIAEWFTSVFDTVVDGLGSIWTNITSWISKLWNNIWDSLVGIGKGIGDWWSNLWSNKSAKVNVTSSMTPGMSMGHAYGGVFNREHIAKFAEGNKKEAIVPLENDTAMQPFVNAVADGLYSVLAPLFANNGSNDSKQPIYVGTLIADEASLRELSKRMQVVQLQDTARRGA